MRSKLLFLIFVLIVTLAALPGSVIANLVPNPGFENGTLTAPTDYPEDWGGWNPGGSSRWFDDGGGADTHGGTKAVGLTGDGSTATMGAVIWPIGTTTANIDIPVTEGTNYYVAVWAKATGGAFSCKVDWLVGDGDDGDALRILPDILRFDNQATTGTWTAYMAGPFQPNAGANFGRPAFYNMGLIEVLFDDVYFDIVPYAGQVTVHTPSPADNNKIVPGTYDLTWEHFGPGSNNIWWDAGSADVNDLNFNVKFDLSDPCIVRLGSVDQDANSVTGVTIAEEGDYHWRVDNGGTTGTVWGFTTVNDPPVVDAGLKQAKWEPLGGGTLVFQLDPNFTDDILPAGEVDQFKWDAVAGVVFDPCEGDGSSLAMAPTASISVPYDYILTFTVTDGTGGTAKPGDDTVLLRVHANAFTGLLARYDCEETDATWGIHDDYSGALRNPLGLYPDFDYSNGTRRGERMNAIGLPNSEEMGKTGTTLVLDGGHNGAIYPGDVDGTAGDGGIQFDGIAGHVYLANSDSDPNFNSWYPYAGDEDEDGVEDRYSDPCWTPSWADLRDEVSVMAWIKVDTDNGGWDDNNEAIITKGYDSTLFGAYRLERNGIGDGILFTCDGVIPSQAGGALPVNDKDPNGNARWHHVAGTYDGAEICVYVDGVIDSCVPTDGAQINLSNAPLVLGELYAYDAESGDDPFQPFGGVMDEIRIHSIGVPHRSSQGDEDDADATISIVKIYRDSGGHISCGTTYVAGDVNQDCYVTIEDVQEMVSEWLECNDIAEPYCDQFGYNQ